MLLVDDDDETPKHKLPNARIILASCKRRRESTRMMHRQAGKFSPPTATMFLRLMTVLLLGVQLLQPQLLLLIVPFTKASAEAVVADDHARYGNASFPALFHVSQSPKGVPVGCHRIQVPSYQVVMVEIEDSLLDDHDDGNDNNDDDDDTGPTMEPNRLLEQRLLVDLPEPAVQNRQNLNVDVDYETGLVQLHGWWMREGRIRGEKSNHPTSSGSQRRICLHQEWYVNPSLLESGSDGSSITATIWDMTMQMNWDDRMLTLSLPISTPGPEVVSEPSMVAIDVKLSMHESSVPTPLEASPPSYYRSVQVLPEVATKLRGLARLRGRNKSRATSGTSNDGDGASSPTSPLQASRPPNATTLLRLERYETWQKQQDDHPPKSTDDDDDDDDDPSSVDDPTLWYRRARSSQDALERFLQFSLGLDDEESYWLRHM